MPDLCSSAHCCEKGVGTRAAKPISFVNKKIDLCDLRTAITPPQAFDNRQLKCNREANSMH